MSHSNARSVEGGERTGVYLTFDTTRETTVEVKIGLSFISSEQARANLEREVGKKSFAEVRRDAEAVWEETLSHISVEGGTDEQRRIFYTALYRSHYMPHDLTGENAWWKSEEPHYEDYYCLWDTFRTLHPLLTLIQTDRQRDMVRSLVDTYRHTGWIPDARVAGTNLARCPACLTAVMSAFCPPCVEKQTNLRVRPFFPTNASTSGARKRPAPQAPAFPKGCIQPV